MSKPGVRLDDDVYEWIMDHRTSKEKTVSAVIRGLIQKCNNLEDVIETLGKYEETKQKED